jgi:hypothetical protein
MYQLHAPKTLSHLGRWDGKFSRLTFFEVGGTDFPAAISASELEVRKKEADWIVNL